MCATPCLRPAPPADGHIITKDQTWGTGSKEEEMSSTSLGSEDNLGETPNPPKPQQPPPTSPTTAPSANAGPQTTGQTTGQSSAQQQTKPAAKKANNKQQQHTVTKTPEEKKTGSGSKAGSNSKQPPTTSNVAHTAVAGSANIATPIPGVVVVIPYAYIPLTDIMCLGIGAGVGSSGLSGGVVYSSQNIQGVLSGYSTSGSGQAGLVGGQVIVNSNGIAGGNSIGMPGGAISGSYSWCY